MDKLKVLPYKVGQLAEARSFITGFRGAWFRCKIKEISLRKGQLGHVLEYYDFPDEKITWTKLYQKPPSYKSKCKTIEKELMVRPQFPDCVYRESEKIDTDLAREVIVVVNDVWRVGDLVDWWTEGCYWSGRITQILGEDKVKLELPPPPVGEGLIYEVLCKDLRPSLDWSPECGWTVPIPEEGENCRPCARLIQPLAQVPSMEEGREDRGAVASSSKFNSSTCLRTSASSMFPPYRSENSPSAETQDRPTRLPNVEENASCSDSISSRDASNDIAGTASRRVQYQCGGSSKKVRTGGTMPTNSLCSDTLEAAILDLEELANKIRWLKRLLLFDSSSSDDMQPSWQFLEHRVSSDRK